MSVIELYNADGEHIGCCYGNGNVTINGTNYVTAGMRDGHKKLLAFIMSYTEENGKAPTYQEIGDFFGISRQRVYQIVCRLEKKGLVARTPDKKRSVRVTIGGKRG